MKMQSLETHCGNSPMMMFCIHSDEGLWVMNKATDSPWFVVNPHQSPGEPANQHGLVLDIAPQYTWSHERRTKFD
jgi:hypothetical protein